MAAGPTAYTNISRALTFFVAPSTLATALLYYFGWAKTYTQMAYFGVDESVLQLSVQDYLLRSVDSIFVPAITVLAIAIASLLTLTLVLRSQRVTRRRWFTRSAVGMTGALGALSLAFGIFSAHFRQVGAYTLIPMSITVGTTALASAVYLYRNLLQTPTQIATVHSPNGSTNRLWVITTTVALGIIILSLFWTVAVYASSVGEERARQAARALDRRISVVVFSPRALNIHGPGIQESQAGGEDSAYRYAYSGLRLLVRSDDRYFLLPQCWSPQRGRAIVLPDQESLRFEFGREAGNC